MLYFLGMSHALSVLKALNANANYDNLMVAQKAAMWWEASQPPEHAHLHLPAFKAFLITQWVAQLEGETLSASPGFWKLLDSIAPTRESNGQPSALVSFLGGNEHSVLTLVDSPVPYDIAMPGASNLPLLKGRQPVPAEAMSALLKTRMNGTLAMLTAIRLKHPDIRILHVMPPPPISSEEQILGNSDEFASAIGRWGITPISVRVKVYRIYSSILADTLSRLGIEAIFPPSDVTDTDGGLLTHYAWGCTHGNEAYGHLVAKQIADALGN